jgi:hypothetical protein
MKFVDEFRAPDVIVNASDEISRLADPQRTYRFMEVCGGHTHAIYRFGLKDLLPANIELVHGPGCPVCVLPMGRIDDGLSMARDANVIFTAFGDMMRVPGGDGGKPIQARRSVGRESGRAGGHEAWASVRNPLCASKTALRHGTPSGVSRCPACALPIPKRQVRRSIGGGPAAGAMQAVRQGMHAGTARGSFDGFLRGLLRSLLQLRTSQGGRSRRRGRSGLRITPRR